MIHTKKSFLRALKLRLCLRLPPDEVRDVIQDYESFFSSGIAEGKTEAELCLEFGSPKQVAGNVLKEEDGRTTLIWFSGLVYIAAALRLAWWYTFNQFTRVGIIYVFALLITPLLFILWGKRKAKYPEITAKWRKRAILMFAATFFVWLIDTLFNTWLVACFTVEGVPLPSFPPYMTGTVIYRFYQLTLVLTAAVLTVSVLLAWTESPWFFLLMSHCVGVMASLGRFISFLRSMDISIKPGFSALCLPPVLVYLSIGIGGTLLTALTVRGRIRYGRSV